jgi:hypothetical protein
VILPQLKSNSWLSRSTLLFRALRSAVEASESGAYFSYKRLGEITSAPKSTLCRWLHGESEPSAEALLCLFERLDVQRRAELLNEICRICPKLESPYVPNPNIISHLMSTLSEPGLTVVTGQGPAVVIFLTAVANTFHIRGREVIGLETQAPTWFSPAQGVIYSDSFDSLESVVNRAPRARGAVIIFNTQFICPKMGASLIKAAQRNHVLLGIVGTEMKLPWTACSRRTITVTCNDR